MVTVQTPRHRAVDVRYPLCGYHIFGCSGTRKVIDTALGTPGWSSDAGEYGHLLLVLAVVQAHGFLPVGGGSST